MIFLFHGSNPSASREAFLQLRSHYSPLAIFSLSGKANFGQFQEICEPGALLGGVRLIMTEIYLKEAGHGQTSLINDEHLPDYLKNKPESTHVALWFDEELPAQHPLLQALNKEKAVRIFRTNLVPPNVFSFLEELANRRRPEALGKFCYWQKMEINNVYLLTMMVWQLRRLLTFFYGASPGRLAPFVRARLSRQIKNFSEKELLSFYEELSVLDVRGKSGETDLSLGLFRLVEKITTPCSDDF